MYEELRAKYVMIYEQLSTIVVGTLKFDEILSYFRFDDEGDYLTLQELFQIYFSVQEEFDYFLPLEIQLKDLTGVGCHSLSYKLMYDWALNNTDNFLGKYKLIIIAPMKKHISLIENLDIEGYILFIYEQYTGKKLEEFFNEEFFNNSLFIFDDFDYSDKKYVEFLEKFMSKKANVVVIGRNLKENQPEISGLTSYTIGFLSPMCELASNDNTKKEFRSIEYLRLEGQLRNSFLRLGEVQGSVIDYISNPIFRQKENSFEDISPMLELISREHRVPHRYPLVISYEDLIKNIIFSIISPLKDFNSEIIPQSLKTVVDWYTAAATNISDKVGIYTYNIGNQLISRNIKNNYISNLGSIEHIKNEITSIVKNVIDKTDMKEVPEEKLGEIIIAKVKVKLKSYKIFSSQTEGGFGYLSSADSEVLDKYREENLEDPDYNKIYREISAISNLDLNAAIRMILQGESPNIPNIDLIYILICSLYVAETARNKSVFLPSLMLLDLCETDPNKKWKWSNIIAQEHNKQMSDGTEITLNNIITAPIISCKNNFGGSHPMTHYGSYYQSVTPLNHRLLTWVEFKCCLIFSEWLSLSCTYEPFDSIDYDDTKHEITHRLMCRLQSFDLISKDRLLLQTEPNPSLEAFLAYQDKIRYLISEVDQKNRRGKLRETAICQAVKQNEKLIDSILPSYLVYEHHQTVDDGNEIFNTVALGLLYYRKTGNDLFICNDEFRKIFAKAFNIDPINFNKNAFSCLIDNLLSFDIDFSNHLVEFFIEKLENITPVKEGLETNQLGQRINLLRNTVLLGEIYTNGEIEEKHRKLAIRCLAERAELFQLAMAIALRKYCVEHNNSEIYISQVIDGNKARTEKRLNTSDKFGEYQGSVELAFLSKTFGLTMEEKGGVTSFL
jgi:hypothetical protein